MKSQKLSLLAGSLFCLAAIGMVVTNIYYQKDSLAYLSPALNLIAGIILLSQAAPKKK